MVQRCCFVVGWRWASAMVATISWPDAPHARTEVARRRRKGMSWMSIVVVLNVGRKGEDQDGKPALSNQILLLPRLVSPFAAPGCLFGHLRAEANMMSCLDIDSFTDQVGVGEIQTPDYRADEGGEGRAGQTRVYIARKGKGGQVRLGDKGYLLHQENTTRRHVITHRKWFNMDNASAER